MHSSTRKMLNRNANTPVFIMCFVVMRICAKLSAVMRMKIFISENSVLKEGLRSICFSDTLRVVTHYVSEEQYRMRVVRTHGFALFRPTRRLHAPRFACRIEAHPETSRARFA